MKRPDIIFVRVLLTPEDEYGDFAKVGSTEIANGICWLAAVTRKKGFKTEIFDAYALRMPNKEAAKALLEKNPKYIGISSTTLGIYEAAELAGMIKKANPSIKIIIGGAHISAVPKETMKRFKEFDIGVVGEGEITIVELLDALEKNKPLNKVKGLILRKGKKLIITHQRELIHNLDSLPLPAWDLLPDLTRYYVPPGWSLHQESSALLMTSRGCHSQCTFCDRTIFGNLCRAHSAEYVMKMIRELYHKYNIKHFRIMDDNFMLFRKRLVEICNKIIEEKLMISWSCLARSDCVDLETLKLMKKSGCWQLSYGIESGSQKILDEEKKGITLEQQAKAVELTRKAGIRVIGFNMIAHPLETEETMQATIDFNKKIKVDDFKTQYLTPFPGSELYRTAHKYGKFDNDWRKMTLLKEPIFIPKGLTKEKVMYYNKKGFLEFYTQPRIIWSYLTQIRSFSDVKAIFTGAMAILSHYFKRSK